MGLLRTSGLLYVVLGLLLTSAAQAQIRVAVEDGSASGSGTGLVAQLNDDTWADFTATKVSASDIDTLVELQNYDVVVLGGSGHADADWNEAMALALKSWVEAGGGAILTGWGNHDMNSVNATHTALDEIFPTQNINSTNDFDSGGTVMTILADHPIFTGLTDFSFPSGCCTEINPLPVEADDLELARINGGSPDTGTIVAVKQPGSGLTVYLGPVYMGSESTYAVQFPELRQGDPDRLLEQAVIWAAEGEFVTPNPTYKIGGSVSGLTGTGLALQNNGVDTLAIAADGPFTFLTELVDTTAYVVTISAQPTDQTCSVTNGSGTIATADVTNVSVDCTDDVAAPMVPVPAMSEWALILLTMLLGLMVFVNRRRLF